MTVNVDPQMQAILSRLRAGPDYDYKAMPIAYARRARDALTVLWSRGAPDIPFREVSIDLDDRQLRSRLYSPVESRSKYLTVFVLGGGWTFGSVDTHDGIMRNLAFASRSPVLGFDYRLAPEHPFPAPLDDVLGTLQFIIEGGLGAPLPPARLAIAGDSAGANLALGALIARRDAGLPDLASGALYYGCYAPVFDTLSHAEFGSGDYILSTADMRWYWTNFLPYDDGAASDRAAPLRCDLKGLPPLYLAAAGLDPLRDDTLMLATKLASAGVPFRCDYIPGVVHGCLRMSGELAAARRIIAASAEFMTSHHHAQEDLTGFL